MIASATDHIVARKSSILGSIGVLVQFPNISGLMDKLGVTLDEIKSSPLKAEPSPFNPTTEPERAMMRAMVLDSYDWFVGLVDERRPLSRAEVMALADGSVFTGRQALQHKLIDALGGEREAVEWLATKGVARSSRWSSGNRRIPASSFPVATRWRKAAADWLGMPRLRRGSDQRARRRPYLP